MATNNFLSDGGEWNTAGNWSLGHVPDSTEDCTFTGIVTPGVTLTIISTGALCKSSDFSTAGEVFTLSGSTYLAVFGSLTFKTGMTVSLSNTIYPAYTATGTLTSNGVSLSSVSEIIVGGELTLADSLNCGTKGLYVYSSGTLITANNSITCGTFGDNNSASPATLTLGSSTINCTNVDFNKATLTVTANTSVFNLSGTNVAIAFPNGAVKLAAPPTNTGTFTLTKGGLDLNGQILTTTVFSSSNTNTRELKDTAGGGKIVVNALTGTIFNMATATNLTVSNSPDIDIGDSNNTLTGNVTFAGGGKTFGDFTVKKHAGNYTCDITGANTFGAFTLETPDATYQYAGVRFTAATTTTVSSFVAAGTGDYQLTLSSITGAEHTLSDDAGTNAVQYLTITNSNATGGATWNALTDNGNVDGGGNTGWVFSSGIAIPIVMHHLKMMRG